MATTRQPINRWTRQTGIAVTLIFGMTATSPSAHLLAQEPESVDTLVEGEEEPAEISP